MIASTGIFKLGTIAIPKIYQGSNLIYQSVLAPQNLLTWSEQANNWGSVGGSTVTANSINAPDTTLTADTLIVSTSSFGCIWRTAYVFTNQEYTLSVHVKRSNYDYVGIRLSNGTASGDRQPFINLTTLAINTLSISGLTMDYELLADDWVRVWVTFTPAAGSGNCDIVLTSVTGTAARTPTAGESVYAWGRQLNEGPIRPYSKTEGTIIP